MCRSWDNFLKDFAVGNGVGANLVFARYKGGNTCQRKR